MQVRGKQYTRSSNTAFSDMTLPECTECTACPCPQLAALEGSPSTEDWLNRAGDWDGEPENMQSDLDSAA